MKIVTRTFVALAKNEFFEPFPIIDILALIDTDGMIIVLADPGEIVVNPLSS